MWGKAAFSIKFIKVKAAISRLIEWGRNMSMKSKYLDEILNIPVGEGCELKLAPVTVSMSSSISSLVKKMIEANVGAVVVVEKGRPVGVVTERDILEKVVEQRKIWI